MVAFAGVGPETSVAPAPPTVSAGETAWTAASPELATVSETVAGWRVFTVAGLTPIDAESAAGTCASNEGLVAGAGSTDAPELTSLAEAPTVNRRVPFCTGENVQANVRVDRPGTVWPAGALVTCAAPVPTKAGVPGATAAPACPALVTSSSSWKDWPTSTCAAERRAAAGGEEAIWAPGPLAAGAAGVNWSAAA